MNDTGRPAPSPTMPLVIGLVLSLVGSGGAATAVVAPQVALSTGASPVDGAWLLSSYAIGLAALTTVWGRIADVYGVRRPLILGISVMAGSAVLGALTQDFVVLVLVRFLQGAGAAAVPVLGLVLIRSLHRGPSTRTALARLNGTAVVGGACGPVLGGILDQLLNWRLVVALPALAVLALPMIHQAAPSRAPRIPLAKVGPVALGLVIAGIVLILQAPATSPVCALSGASLLILAGIILTRDSQADERARLFGVLSTRAIRAASVAASTVPACFYGMLVVLPIWLGGRGWSSFELGAALLIGLPAGLVGPLLARGILNRFGAITAAGGSALIAAVALAATELAVHTEPLLTLTSIFGLNLAYVIAQTSFAAAVSTSAPEDSQGAAMGVATVIYLLGAGVGSAMAGSVGLLGITLTVGLLTMLPAAVGVAVLVGNRKQL